MLFEIFSTIIHYIFVATSPDLCNNPKFIIIKLKFIHIFLKYMSTKSEFF